MTNNLVFNLFAFSGLVLGVTSFLMVVLLVILGRTTLHRVLAFCNISIAIWGFGSYIIGLQHDPIKALIAWKVAYAGVIFIAVFFYHSMCLFAQINRSKIIVLAYLQGVFFLILDPTNLLLSGVFYLKNSFYCAQSTWPWYFVSFCIWISLVIAGFLELIFHFKEFEGIRRKQAAYIFFGFAVGFFSGVTNFFPMLGIKIIPFGNVTIPIYCLVVTYALLRYKILDLKVVITRLGVFIAVYSLVLGIPVGIGFKLMGGGLWLWPMALMGICATVGPFLYISIEKRAEDRLFEEQRRYQATLRQASAGMGKIKDLKKLLNMIVSVLTHAIEIEHALVYIYDDVKKNYILGASRIKSVNERPVPLVIDEKSLLPQFLSNDKNIIIFEEIRQRSQDYNDPMLFEMVEVIAELHGALIVPVLIDQFLVAIIVIGKKESGKLYTQDDIGVFSILANQTALAIENAKFYEDMKLAQEQLFQAEKMATIGTMADGLSHQINNRFHALGFIAGDALDTIRLSQKNFIPEKWKEVLEELAHAFMRVQENVTQGGEIVQGLLKYTRKGDAGLVPVDINAVFKAALEMAQLKIKVDDIHIVRDYRPSAIPWIKGNFTQLQEVFFNLIDNSYDAMMQRKHESQEENYRPTLTVRVMKNGSDAEIIFEDNGMGVKEENRYKLFAPFFTTKLSSKKGTGLGLYVIKKIIEENHKGKVEMISQYMQGAQIKLRLPIAIG